MFPLDSIDMDKFIFDDSKKTWDDYISNIKKLLGHSSITTNDSPVDEKNKHLEILDKKGIINIDNNSNCNSFEEKDYGIFSNNDSLNLEDFI